jgi:hypothetical protein
LLVPSDYPQLLPVSARAQQLQANCPAVSEYHKFKEEQFSKAAQVYNGYPDPIGLAPKTVTMVAD